jgi:hypothetical protein
MIPARKSEIKDENKRFYVMAKASVHLALQQEAFKRGTDLWTLGGFVIASWLDAGCPDQIAPRESAE